MPSLSKTVVTRAALTATCLVVLGTFLLMIDLKGISTDEGQRIWLINAGLPFTVHAPPPAGATWAKVIAANSYTAYPPLYFLMQNALMRLAGTQGAVFFRLVNIFFLWVGLQGLIALSRGWRLAPRLFLIVVFSFNAYLFMHVLQIREYIVGVAFYIWSTWLVLRLDVRKVAGGWTDVTWFAAYGVLLVAGFYMQSWVVFPAIGQFLFLIRRRRVDGVRGYAHLALSYLVVLSATLPYLQTNHQKVDIGRWGAVGTSLWGQLWDGFHLVLTGHMAGQSPFTNFLFWFWLLFIAGSIALVLSRKFETVTEMDHPEFRRQGLLMGLCLAVSLAFQIGYFLKVDTLSMWPRYFVIHYFFLIWLIALGFKYLGDLRAARERSGWARHGLGLLLGAIAALAVASGIFQTRSYYRFPYLDTGFSRESNYRTMAAELTRLARPGDALLIHDFIIQATFAFTQPMPNRLILLGELHHTDLHSTSRVLYLESTHAVPETPGLVARMSNAGFTVMHEIPLHTTDGNTVLPDWRVLDFQRP